MICPVRVYHAPNVTPLSLANTLCFKCGELLATHEAHPHKSVKSNMAFMVDHRAVEEYPYKMGLEREGWDIPPEAA
jgi:hypothetical protein